MRNLTDPYCSSPPIEIPHDAEHEVVGCPVTNCDQITPKPKKNSYAIIETADNERKLGWGRSVGRGVGGAKGQGPMFQ